MTTLITPEVDTQAVEQEAAKAITPDVAKEATETTAKLPEGVSTLAAEGVVVDNTSNQIATVSAETSTALTTSERKDQSIKSFVQAQAEMGYEGLEVGAFSFDRVKLASGEFLLGSDEESIGKEFNFITLSSRNIYIVARSADEDETEMYYSYCEKGLTKTDGTSAEETLNEWKEDGYGVEGSPISIKKYMEVMAELVDRDDEHEGCMVSLSLPPSALQRFGGVSFQAGRRYNTHIGGVVLEASVGKRAGEGKKAWNPWNFKIVRKL